MKTDKGFTLIEIIVVLVLIGILAVGASLFLITGVNGYLFAEKNSETIMKVQNALERLSLEIRDATAITSPTSSTPATSLNYNITEGTTSVSKTVALGSNILTITGYPTTTPSTTPILLDNVAANGFSISVVCLELDPTAHEAGSTTQEVSHVDISTTIVGIPTFTTKIYPRNLIACPY